MKRCLGLFSLLALLGCASDPLYRDPASFPPETPPSMTDFPIASNGSQMNAIVYRAAGPGPHPTVVLLHGLPGNERNLDLAQAARRAGYTVLFFHYRGAWGSQGDFSFSNALEDVAAAVAVAASPEFASAHRADPTRIALVGHSMGGFMALHAGSRLPAVACIGSLAGANLGRRAAGLTPEARAAVAEGLQALTGPLHGTSGERLLADLEAHPESFDLLTHAQALAEKPVLLVAGSRDRVVPAEDHHLSLSASLRAAGAGSLTTRTLDADHAFSSRRIALGHTVVGWLDEHCFQQPSSSTGGSLQ